MPQKKTNCFDNIIYQGRVKTKRVKMRKKKKKNSRGDS